MSIADCVADTPSNDLQAGKSLLIGSSLFYRDFSFVPKSEFGLILFFSIVRATHRPCKDFRHPAIRPHEAKTVALPPVLVSEKITFFPTP
jgi:hypothetical protein